MHWKKILFLLSFLGASLSIIILSPHSSVYERRKNVFLHKSDAKVQPNQVYNTSLLSEIFLYGEKDAIFKKDSRVFDKNMKEIYPIRSTNSLIELKGGISERDITQIYKKIESPLRKSLIKIEIITLESFLLFFLLDSVLKTVYINSRTDLGSLSKLVRKYDKIDLRYGKIAFL